VLCADIVRVELWGRWELHLAPQGFFSASGVCPVINPLMCSLPLFTAPYPPKCDLYPWGSIGLKRRIEVLQYFTAEFLSAKNSSFGVTPH